MYQGSDPACYPLEDPDLRLGYDALSCLQAVSKLASQRDSYCFELFDRQ